MNFALGLGDLPTWIGAAALWFAALGTWVAAVGTVGTLAAALVQINDERLRRHVLEERERLVQHRAQARLISAVMGPIERASQRPEEGRTAVDLLNSSEEPVYGIVVAVVFIQGAGPDSIERWLEVRGQDATRMIPITTVSILPDGTYRVWIAGAGWHQILSGRNGAEVAFTDRNGGHWIRRATGRLEELPEEPFSHFAKLGFYGPHDLQTPERIA